MSTFMENFPCLLRLPEVRKRVGLSRAAIYSLAAQGKFPKPVKLGPRTSAWVSAEVTEWIESRIAASRGGAK